MNEVKLTGKLMAIVKDITPIGRLMLKIQMCCPRPSRSPARCESIVAVNLFDDVALGSVERLAVGQEIECRGWLSTGFYPVKGGTETRHALHMNVTEIEIASEPEPIPAVVPATAPDEAGEPDEGESDERQRKPQPEFHGEAVA
jgi:hypothetical protein